MILKKGELFSYPDSKDETKFKDYEFIKFRRSHNPTDNKGMLKVKVISLSSGQERRLTLNSNKIKPLQP